MLRMDGRLTRLPLLGYQEHLPGADNVYRHIDSELGFRCTDGGVRFRRRFAGESHCVQKPLRRLDPYRNSVRCDFRGVELLSASDDPASDRHGLHLAELTFRLPGYA